MRRGLVVLAMAVWIAACGTTPEPTVTDAPPIRAYGNEPFWNVEISAEGGMIYTRLDEPTIAFRYAAPTSTADSVETLVYGPVTDSSGGHRIEVRIEKRRCPDSMADIVHPMFARVVLDGETLTGCARPLGDVPEERP
jgi:putative lipoprotein